MKHNLGRITDDKAFLIINNGMEEFINHGYENISVLEILRESGVTKEAIYEKYLEKKNFFSLVLDFAEDTIKSYILEQVDFTIPDILKRVQGYMDQMLDLLTAFPKTVSFIYKFITDSSEDIKNMLSDKNSTNLQRIEEFMFLNVDKSLFKDGVDVDKAIFSIRSTLEKVVHSSLDSSNSNIGSHERITEYINFFRDTFYK